MNKGGIIAIVVVLLLAVGGGAYYFISSNKTEEKQSTTSQTKETTQEKPVEATKATDIKSATAAWKKEGLTVGEDQGAFFEMIGASAGGKYDVDGTVVEIYEFSSDSDAKSKIETFSTDSNTVFTEGSLLVLIHSVDKDKVAAIKSVF